MSTREQRRRILEVLRLADDYAPPRVPGPAARRRILEVMRLEAGLPVRPPEAARPALGPHRRARGEPIDIAALENEWEEGQRKYRRHLAEVGLSEDMYGRIHCGACGDWVPASTKGICGGSMRALALWHAFFCEARQTRRKA